jgi:hypothetical protein
MMFGNTLQMRQIQRLFQPEAMFVFCGDSKSKANGQ